MGAKDAPGRSDGLAAALKDAKLRSRLEAAYRTHARWEPDSTQIFLWVVRAVVHGVAAATRAARREGRQEWNEVDRIYRSEVMSGLPSTWEALAAIRTHVSKALFRSVMMDLFNRLMTTKKRVIARRQMAILNLLLEAEEGVDFGQLIRMTEASYSSLKNPRKALVRDLSYLLGVDAVRLEVIPPENRYRLSVNLDWPTKITEGEFFDRVRHYPRAKSLPFLQWGIQI